MHAKIKFSAPWGARLRKTAWGIAFLTISVPVAGLLFCPGGSKCWVTALAMLSLALLLVMSLFIIRGYSIAKGMLIVHRFGWSHRIRLSKLLSVSTDKSAMDSILRSIRKSVLRCLFGAGQSRRLGPYRVFATNPENSVVLRFMNNSVIVTPEDPELFVAIISKEI